MISTIVSVVVVVALFAALIAHIRMDRKKNGR